MPAEPSLVQDEFVARSELLFLESEVVAAGPTIRSQAPACLQARTWAGWLARREAAADAGLLACR
jgi:hypothetical protein